MTDQGPRLRVERLMIVESRSPTAKFIRDVPLHAGLNIVWAQELPAAEGATEVDRAGHGVGKSTFSLMLRAVLGDDGVAVKTMRGHLAEHFGSGGIAAEVVAGGERFAVFRSFGSQSFALKNGTVEGLFEEGAKDDALDFSAYVTVLGEQACLRHLPTRALPVTGQAVEWGHVLCWIARDQALGLRQYFEWRNDDGTGLRRKVKDPPALVRLALGLLRDAEATAEEKISSLGGELSKAREALKIEDQRGANVRGIVESQLRQWAGVSNSLQMVADDLFSDSVEKEIQRKTRQLETKNHEDRAAIEELELELVALAGEIQARERIVQLAKARWEETVALQNNDEESLKEIRERRDKLLTLSGTCQHAGIAFDDCRHVQEQRSTVKLTAQRDDGVLSKALDERQAREDAEKADYEREAKVLAELTAAWEKKNARKRELSNAIDGRSRQLGRSEAIRETLTQWQESHQAPETERLRAARTVVVELEQKVEAAKRAKISAQQQVSDRERLISQRIAKLAEVFGVNGRYVPSEEKRPFQMLGADGDAYTVLEILLGDLASAEDGAEGGGGAHPGLLIFDCPREREMSPHLYDRFLTLVDEVCRKAPRLQVIITTTTPPPEPLREPPTRVLKLSRATEDLLLKRRIENLLSRAAASSSDEEEP
jgi:hypothetical protein